ncbi:MAG TPA: methyltransferase [Aliidongia sp.]|nr:methyltransferase [Aliidongia sp.]
MNKANAAAVSDRTVLYAAEDQHAAMYNMISGYNVAQAVRCAALFSLADHLSDGPATADEIARAEGLDPGATFRLMRACASFGLMTYDKSTGFAATPLLETLRKDDPRSLRGMAIALGGQGHWAPWGRLDDAIRTGEPQAKATLGSSLWDYYGKETGAAEGAAFTQAVGGMTSALVVEAARLIDTGSAGFAVDVGGANGGLIHALLKENPSLRGAVFDLPHVEADARKVAEAQHVEDRLSVVAGDFFTEVPAADLYLLKHILHDWADEACLSILKNCRRATHPGARMVVIEMLMDEIGPTPFSTRVDLTMMVVLGAKERTLEEYEALLGAAGFRVTGVVPTATPVSLIEAVAV